MKIINSIAVHAVLTIAVVILCGCGDAEIEGALDSDANGYICMSCDSKFYTERKDFARACPDCGEPNIEQVLGYFCTVDQHATLAARTRTAVKCERCGVVAEGRSIPKESDLVSWGATKRTMEDVSTGN